MNLSDLYQYIIGLWNSNPTLSTYTLYLYEAPEGQCHPVCTYRLVNNNRDFTFCEAMDTFYVQLEVFCTYEQIVTGIALRDEIVQWFDNRRALANAYNIEMVSVITTGQVADQVNKGYRLFIELEISCNDEDGYDESSESSSSSSY